MRGWASNRWFFTAHPREGKLTYTQSSRDCGEMVLVSIFTFLFDLAQCAVAPRPNKACSASAQQPPRDHAVSAFLSSSAVFRKLARNNLRRVGCVVRIEGRSLVFMAATTAPHVSPTRPRRTRQTTAFAAADEWTSACRAAILKWSTNRTYLSLSSCGYWQQGPLGFAASGLVLRCAAPVAHTDAKAQRIACTTG